MTVEDLDPYDRRVGHALRSYLTEVLAVCGMNGDSLADAVTDVADYCKPTGAFLGVIERDIVIACAGLRQIAPGVGEIKRMWVAPAARGRGLGAAVLAAIEATAADLGLEVLRLDTHEGLVSAMALYSSHGYREIGAYNDNPDATHFFEKDLRTI